MATSEIKKTFSSADQKDSMGPKSDVEAGDIIAMGVMEGAGMMASNKTLSKTFN